MIKRKDIDPSHLDVGENVQIVVTDVSAIMGKVGAITDSFILLEPHNNDKLTEQFGEAVPAETFVPFEHISFIIKLIPKPETKEDGKKKEKS